MRGGGSGTELGAWAWRILIVGLIVLCTVVWWTE